MEGSMGDIMGGSVEGSVGPEVGGIVVSVGGTGVGTGDEYSDDDFEEDRTDTHAQAQGSLPAESDECDDGNGGGIDGGIDGGSGEGSGEGDGEGDGEGGYSSDDFDVDVKATFSDHIQSKHVEENAAVLIQRTVRGRSARSKVTVIRVNHSSATRIQSLARGRRHRRHRRHRQEEHGVRKENDGREKEEGEMEVVVDEERKPVNATEAVKAVTKLTARKKEQVGKEGGVGELAASSAPPPSFKVGDKVRSRFAGKGHYYPAQIVAAPDGGTFSLLFADGDEEDHVQPGWMKLVEAAPPASSTSFVSATGVNEMTLEQRINSALGGGGAQGGEDAEGGKEVAASLTTVEDSEISRRIQSALAGETVVVDEGGSLRDCIGRGGQSQNQSQSRTHGVAAVRIQAAHRARKARGHVEEKRKHHRGAVRIQAAHRARKARGHVEEKRKHHRGAVRIQSSFRGRHARTHAKNRVAERRVGGHVDVCWVTPTGIEEWHKNAEIKQYDPKTRKHLVAYGGFMKGTEEWHDLGGDRCRPCKKKPAEVAKEAKEAKEASVEDVDNYGDTDDFESDNFEEEDKAGDGDSGDGDDNGDYDDFEEESDDVDGEDDDFESDFDVESDANPAVPVAKAAAAATNDGGDSDGGGYSDDDFASGISAVDDDSVTESRGVSGGGSTARTSGDGEFEESVASGYSDDFSS
jgi:hypothetical protein